jgi:hypothetical protein
VRLQRKKRNSNLVLRLNNFEVKLINQNFLINIVYISMDMYRIVNIDDPAGSNLVALELAINDSSPQANVRMRVDDDLAAVGIARAAHIPIRSSALT